MKISSFSLLCLLFMSNLAMGQSYGPRSGNVKGSVFEVTSGEPVEYANVILFSSRTEKQVKGGTTDETGQFEFNNVPPGRYYLEIRFMGYENKRIDEIIVQPGAPNADLGVIPLQSQVLETEGVSVEGERAAVTYEIDKKVVNVEKMQTAVSGSAIEILENIPSITVDIENNISLRGSSSFTLLIDGRPTVLDASDALNQIPAGSIKEIEIITNPSSKFDPEGTAGIINIILKKNTNLGRSALINLNAGRNNKYGADVLYQSKHKKYSYQVGVDYNRRTYKGSAVEEIRTQHDNLTSYVNSTGGRDMNRLSAGVRGSFTWDIADSDILTLDGRFNDGSFNHDSNRDYTEWDEASPERLSYDSYDVHERGRTRVGVNMDWLHKFAKKGHELQSQLNYGYRDGDETSVTELLNSDNRISEGMQSTEAGPSTDVRIKIDYTLPFSKDRKLKAGLQSEWDVSTEETTAKEYDTSTGNYMPLPHYEHTTDYQRNTHALYLIFSDKLGNIGIQGGIRSEYTDRLITLKNESRDYTINRWDIFSTLHTSYQMNNNKQVMASYTRRIRRPRSYQLEPFETWMDAYNVRTGNPALKPQYIDSYEAGYSMPLGGKNMLSTEVYYRIGHDRIDRVRSVYDKSITLHTMDNTGTDYALGTEVMFDWDVFKTWNMGLTGNLYDYRIEGTLNNRSFSRRSFNWSARMNNTLNITPTLRFQLTGRYHSASVSSQGRREPFFMTDVALRKDFLDRAVSATLQVRDLFDQGRFEFTSEGEDFYSYTKFTRESRIVMLNIRINLNNYEQERRRRMNGNDMQDMEGEDPMY
ncbi:MAG: TonB-dependent receptor [candidate division KSB1 bacterium]|nr:TonB-dependent receptor [candidate division KSB1 bacterium]